MRMAAILLCLVLGSSYLVAGMFAKYTTSDSGANSARTAKFNFYVKDGTDSHIVDLSGINKPGDSKTYSFSVNSASEVSVTYDITLEVNGSMPLTASVNKAATPSVTVLSVTVPGDDDGDSVTKSGAGTFTPNAASADSYELTVNWPSDQNDLAYASAGSAAVVRLIVTGKQVD